MNDADNDLAGDEVDKTLEDKSFDGQTPTLMKVLGTMLFVCTRIVVRYKI